MKKILFMLINMNVGGTEKALLTMLSEIPKDKYEITLLMMEKYGGFLDYIPDGVRIEYVQDHHKINQLVNEPPWTIASDFVKQGKWMKGFSVICLHVLSKLRKDRSTFLQYVFKDYPVKNERYDVAVAYAGPVDFVSYYIAHKIKADKKVQWIHFDITQISFSLKFAAKVYAKFNKIFVVSTEAREKFVKAIPKLEEKTESFFNILSKDFVQKMADEGNGFEDEFDGIRFLTVGRLCREKGQDLTIPVLARLKAEGYRVRWYCIGDGSEREEYERIIAQHGVENEYILLGANPNPYPFMKQCDVYVQSSRHEGYCITLSEARCFDNPIVSTNFTGSGEQITHNQTGLIVHFDELQMYQAVKRLLDDGALRNTFKQNLRNERIDTREEIHKLYQLADVR